MTTKCVKCKVGTRKHPDMLCPTCRQEADREERALDALIVAAMRGIDPDKLARAIKDPNAS